MERAEILRRRFALPTKLEQRILSPATWAIREMSDKN
jgi:hypothetical protein